MSKFIVSFNLFFNHFKNGQLEEYKFINRRPFPILYNSEEGGSFKEELENNQILYKSLSELNTFNYMNYSNISISGIKYNLETQDYSELTLNIQDLFLLKDIPDGEVISLDVIEYLLHKMYVKCQGDPTLLTENDARSNILVIYNHIKKVYPEEFNEEAIEMYIENKLVNDTRLNTENASYVFDKFKEIVYNV